MLNFLDEKVFFVCWEISPAHPNLLNRNFKAKKPNEKWLTDITEFRILAGKSTYHHLSIVTMVLLLVGLLEQSQLASLYV